MNLDSYQLPTKVKNWLVKQLLADTEARKLLNEYSFTLGAFITITSYLQKLYSAKKYVSEDTFSDTYGSIVEHIHEKLSKDKTNVVHEKPLIKILDDLGSPENISSELGVKINEKSGFHNISMVLVTFIAWAYTILLNLAIIGVLALAFGAIAYSLAILFIIVSDNNDFAGVSGSSVFAQVSGVAALPIGILLLIVFATSWNEKRLLWKTLYAGITYFSIAALLYGASYGVSRLMHVKSPENLDSVVYQQKLITGNSIKIEADNAISILVSVDELMPKDQIRIESTSTPYFPRNWFFSNEDTVNWPTISVEALGNGYSHIKILDELISGPFIASKYEGIHQEVRVILPSYNYHLSVLGQEIQGHALFSVVHGGFSEADITRIHATQTEYCSEEPVFKDNDDITFEKVCQKREETTGLGIAMIEIKAK